MIGGCMGKILRIDLSNQEYTKERLNEDLYRKFIGSRGLGSKLFYDEVPSNIEPHSIENKVIIMTGLFNGTRVPATPKHTWTTKSPLTGFCGEGSTSGGKFAIYLKQNGYDGMIIEGKSPNPVYIIIRDEEVYFKNASQMWGLTVTETEKMLNDVYKDIQLAIIGPAGENKVRFAAVRVERRTVGRTGIGSVLGSKNLKAIGIMPGKSEVEIKDKRTYTKLIKEFYHAILENEFTSKTRKIYGTTHMFITINDSGIMPTRNFQLSKFEKEISDFVHTNIRKKYIIRDEACYRCPICCGKKMLVKEGEYAGTSNSGPEWETMWSFGPQCDNNNFASIIKANEMCNELGLDTISTGNVIGFAMECYDRGLISVDELGYTLNWGDKEAMLKLIHDIAYRNKYGNELAEGTRTVAAILGSEDIAIQVKGLELPAYDPRSIWGMGLAYATSSRGGCHLRSFTPTAELKGLGGGRNSIIGKADFIVKDQNIRALYEATGQCFTSTSVISLEYYVKLLSSVIGYKLDVDNLYTIGERIYNVERLLANREGITKKDDTLPGRIFKEEVKNGPAKGMKLPENLFQNMLQEYYHLRGWDTGSGIPKKEKLKELEL